MNQYSGTLTFLATDIEGSTDMWQRYPRAMPAALARHDALLERVIGEHGGEIFKNVGDGMFSAFESASRAVSAALAAQRELLAQSWETDQPVCVRMALHSGEAETRDGDYFGLAVNRVARILSAGHGGQILLSQSVERLAAEQFPPGVALRDLGMRALKDLTEPERIFQLVADGLAAEFPPLNTLDVRPNNLPAQATVVVGRGRELEEIRELLLRSDTRLVTLTGPSGTGKTRLGVQVAAESVDAFQDGVFLVDLAVVYDPDRVADAILKALDAEAAGEEDSRAALVRHIGKRELLLVLDNFEQVIDAASLVADLLRESGRITCLVTSQAALRIRGEHEYPVPPLSIPDPRALPAVEKLLNYEAVALFTERARAVQPSFRVDEENARAVAQIVHQLDGLPLAIELAAARIKLFPPRALVQRLGRRFDFLTAGTRDLPDRQRTLRGALLWSYNLLDDAEKALFRRLAVFDGGFTIEAAEQVCVAEDEAFDVVEILTSLVDKSLLRVVQGSLDEPRFERLRTIRDFSLELLEESGETERWRRRHAEMFAELAQTVGLSSAGHPEVGRILARVSAEYENIRVALVWALESGEPSLAVRLAQAMPVVWFRRGFIEDGWRLLEELEPHLHEVGDLERAHALALTGRFAQIQGDNSPEVIARFEESLEIYRAEQHDDGVARALMNIGNARSREGAFDKARALFEEALEFYRKSDDPFQQCNALINLGDAYLSESEVDRAAEYFEEAHEIARRSGTKISLGFAKQYLGIVACKRKRFDDAKRLFEESLAIFEALGARPGILWSQLYLAGVWREQGDPAAADEAYRRLVGEFEELRMKAPMAAALLGLASIAVDADDIEAAARLLGAADARFAAVSFTRSGLERDERERIRRLAETTLGESRVSDLLSEGRRLTVAEALDVPTADAART